MKKEFTLPPDQRFGLVEKPVVQDDLPESARRALVVVHAELIRKKLVGGWKGLIREAERTARVLPHYGNRRVAQEQERLENLLLDMKWYDLLYFCELIYEKHLQPIEEADWRTRATREVRSLADVREEYETDINRILVEESIALEFVDGHFRRVGQAHTQAVVARAVRTMASPELEEARRHYKKALDFALRVENPDYENAVKEAVLALESAGKELVKSRRKDFDKVLLDLQGPGSGQVPPALVGALRNIYGFRGAAKGVAHGGATGGVVDEHVAELIISWVGSAIIFLATRGGNAGEAPF